MFRNPSWTCCGPLFLCVWIFGSTLVSGSLLAQTPDVFLFDLQELGSFGQENGIYAYSVGTTSCNIGSVELLWHANDRFHPVIGQEMYRYYDGVLEQIGVSWLKHSFCALSLDACGSCQPTDCDTLGIGCSDPYTAGLNGQQSNLGPRSQVNAFTGVFPYPVDPPMPPFVTVIDRRLQVEEALIDPALNPNTLYFVTGHYISPDDAEGGNGDNNVAYRQVTISDDPASFPLNFVPGTPTQSGQPGKATATSTGGAPAAAVVPSARPSQLADCSGAASTSPNTVDPAVPPRRPHYMATAGPCGRADGSQ